SSGIGRATAIEIGAAGGSVVLVARGVDKLRATAAEVEAKGGTAHVHPCDLTDMAAIDKLVAAVLAEHGRIDVLVNNAGRSIRRSLALSYERFHDFERTMQLNYFAPLRLMLAILPGMRQRRFGHVINISSIGVQTKVPRFGAYIASKAALDTVSDAFQAETHGDGVRFTTVHMPLVRTPMIAPTTLYDNFPSLTPDEAGHVVCEAIVTRPRRFSPAFGRVASFADSITPEIMDYVRNKGFAMFPDSAAATGRESGTAEPHDDPSVARRVFVEFTNGNHW
ncbi:MAG: SDR family NAD(P)-dependent oxidoreductase, partial [Pseudonocardia sp.]|nr:SDR family NAD(P)-dependent oxidoreductase [Pseudonocardia sp.]